MSQRKILSTYIDKYQFFPKYAIYDENHRFRISKYNKHEATIYLIVKTPKVRFVENSFYASSDYCFGGKIRVAEKEHDIIFSPLKFHYNIPDIKQQFGSSKSFASWCMDQWTSDDSAKKTEWEKYRQISRVETEETTSERLVIDCAIARTISKSKHAKFYANPYQLIDFFNIDVLGPLEILYIGKSNDDTWSRVYNHNKWGFLEEHKDDSSEDFLVYFLRLDESLIKEHRVTGFTTIYRDYSGLKLEHITRVSEMAFINYFIREKKVQY